MKKFWVLLSVAAILTGCGNTKAAETVSDVYEVPVSVAMQQMVVSLPRELEAPAFQSEESGTLYLCEDYTVTLQTVSSGDLDKTVREITGRGKDAVQIIKTQQGSVQQYQFVWSYSDEAGIGVGRASILDDGNYHYILTAQTGEENTGKVQPVWQEMFASFRLISGDVNLNTGS